MNKSEVKIYPKLSPFYSHLPNIEQTANKQPFTQTQVTTSTAGGLNSNTSSAKLLTPKQLAQFEIQYGQMKRKLVHEMHDLTRLIYKFANVRSKWQQNCQ
jgi:hypothetical protein